MTNQEIKTVGQTIAAETQIGGNTAERVGGVIEGIGEALDNKDAAVGYYLATMSGSTIYINASSYRLGTGGNLRAKMPAAATTACTLTVGNANAVQLWYNGAAVSADNSWEAGEIVTIFYDGTRFMASNSQGGGGQFGSGEKIKDILLSQVLGAGTAAITSQKGVSDAIFNEIDISSIDTLKTLNDALAPSSSLKPTYYTVTAMLNSVKLKVGSMAVISDNMRHVVTEIMATHYLLDDAGNLTNEHSDAEIFFIYRSVKLSGGTLPDPAGTWTKWRYVNSSVWSTAAEKIKYDNSQSGLDAENVQEAIDEQSENTRELSEKLFSTETISTAINEGYIKSSDGTISSPSIYHYSDAIQVQEGQVIHTRACGSNAVLVLAAYGETYAAILEKSIVGNDSIMTIDYVVPAGIKYIRVCTRPEYVDIAITKSTPILQTMQVGLGEVEDAVFNLTDATTIPAGASTKGYYTYENGNVVINSNNNYRYWPAIDVSGYFALQITFSIPVNPNPAGAKTFFTDENDIMVGDFLYNKDDTARVYLVPEGAKKLYWSTYYGSKSPFVAIALKGIKRLNKIDELTKQVNALEEEIESSKIDIRPSDGTTYSGVGVNAQVTPNVFSSGSNFVSVLFPAVNGRKYIIETSASDKYGFGLIKNATPVVGDTVVYPTGQSFNYVDNVARRYEFDITEDGCYFFIRNDNRAGYRNFPTFYCINEDARFIERNELLNEVLPNSENPVKSSAIYNFAKNSLKEIKILFIGNSLTQDVVTYVPLLLRELAPDLKFKIYIWYNGGYTLSQQLADFNNNVACDIFSVCEDGISWANFNNSVTMASVLATYKFDIVSIQEYFNYQEISDVTTFNSVVEYIENHYAYPFKVVTLFHQPKRDTPAVIFERTKAGNALFLKDTVAEDMIPSGIAIYRALSTSLDSLGDQGHLSPDGTHAQEGLPCMMQAYVTAMWILKQVGIPMSVNNASSIVDDSNYASINVPGPNLGTGVVVGTTEQVRLSQKVAIKAFKEGEYFVNANLTEYTT